MIVRLLLALRDLKLREFALPFDWVVSNITILEKCFQSDFTHFHKSLVFNYNKTRLIDFYGFQFPHDYPLNTNTNTNNIEVVNNIGESIFGEEKGKFISDKWCDYYDFVLEKYKRRIERFRHIVSDIKPIIVLCRYNTRDVLKLQQLFIKYYNKENIYFVNSSNEIFENDKIKNIYTEKNNTWNETSMWKQGIDDIMTKIK